MQSSIRGTTGSLAPEIEVAIAWAKPGDRNAFRALFELDRRLADVVATSSEAMIGQMRLAWWRDILSMTSEVWPQGEPLLASLRENFGASALRLVPLVDGWEALLVAEQFDGEVIEQFVAGRQAAWLALGHLLEPDASREAIAAEAKQWALGDLAAHLTSTDDRGLAISAARSAPGRMARLPRKLRTFAILGALGRTAIKGGGHHLMEGRLAALQALRIGMIGR